MKIRLFTIPNAVTLANLFCGCVAIIFALRGELQTAFIFIVIAAVFDFLDGFVARALKATSELGKQLDSLCDVVSFGVAPSMVLYSMYASAGGEQWWAYGAYVLFLVALFSALRLAKFNIDVSQKDKFVGLPTPACGIFIAASGAVFASHGLAEHIHPAYILGTALLFSYLLVSPIEMFAFKFHNWSIKDNALRYIFILLSLVGVVLFKVVAVPFIILAYIVVSLGTNIVCNGEK